VGTLIMPGVGSGGDITKLGWDNLFDMMWEILEFHYSQTP